MQKESEAQITAIAADATTTASKIPSLPKSRGLDDDENLGEIPQGLQNLSLRFSGLPQEGISRIFQNKVKQINLHRLRHMKDLCYDTYRDRDRIGIEDGMLRLKRIPGIRKDFGKVFQDVSSDCFLKYAMITMYLLVSTALNLHAALSLLHSNILQLSKVYEVLAIEAHTQIPFLEPTEPRKLVIPLEFQEKFGNPYVRTEIGPKQAGGHPAIPSSPPLYSTWHGVYDLASIISNNWFHLAKRI